MSNDSERQIIIEKLYLEALQLLEKIQKNLDNLPCISDNKWLDSCFREEKAFFEMIKYEYYLVHNYSIRPKKVELLKNIVRKREPLLLDTKSEIANKCNGIVPYRAVSEDITNINDKIVNGHHLTRNMEWNLKAVRRYASSKKWPLEFYYRLYKLIYIIGPDK